MRLSFSSAPQNSTVTLTGQLAQLSVALGQSSNFEHLATILKTGLQAIGLEGCFLVSCFGFNRETRFGHWASRYVFPLRSDLSERSSSLILRDNLIVVSSGYFTLVVSHASAWQAKEPSIADNLLMLCEAARLWVKNYTNQVDQEFDSLNHRKASCKQLLDIVQQLDDSGREVTSTHKRIVTAINAGIPMSITMLNLTPSQQEAVMDEFDEMGRAYSIFTKQQMELHRQLKEQVRSIASYLLAKEQ